MSHIKLSVIIPVYNVEDYIERCVRSLMRQTLRESIEFIFVDDYSSDDSMAILRQVLKDYPERELQVRIIQNKCNQGIYKTRCIGAEVAAGDYIGWVDSDDWVDIEMFERMLEASDDGLKDIVVCNYIEYRPERITEICFRSSNTPIESIIGNLSGMAFSGTLWNQIFRRDLFVKHMYDIIPTNYSEDTYIIWHIYCNAKSIKYVQKPLYHYDKRNQKSLMHTRSISYDAWVEQEKNLKCIDAKKYSAFKRYRRSLHYFMFCRKYEYCGAFESPLLFYWTLRKASLDILFFPGMTLCNRWKIFIINNVYFLFWLRNKFYVLQNNK